MQAGAGSAPPERTDALIAPWPDVLKRIGATLQHPGWYPCRASSIAAASPTRPPPMMVSSCAGSWLSGLQQRHHVLDKIGHHPLDLIGLVVVEVEPQHQTVVRVVAFADLPGDIRGQPKMQLDMPSRSLAGLTVPSIARCHADMASRAAASAFLRRAASDFLPALTKTSTVRGMLFRRHAPPAGW